MIINILLTLSIAFNLFFALKTIYYKEWAEKEAQTRLSEILEVKEKQIKEDAFSRSRSVTFGKTIEKFVPFIDDFPADPREAVFLGKPIDYICFVNRNSKNDSVVRFVEIKSGSSNLNKHQQNIKEAVLNKRVEWHEVTVEGLSDEEKHEGLFDEE